MPTVKQAKIVPYTPAQMYDLVNDVAHYQDFLPWCTSSKVIHQDQSEVRAELTLSASGIEKSFITSNHLKPKQMIEIHLVQGPFKHLHGFWRFTEVGDDQCRISLDLQFEFSNKLLSMMFGPVFHKVATTLVQSFEDRAGDVYA